MTPFVYCPNLKKFNALVYPLRDNFDEVLGFDRNHCAEMRTLAAPTSLQVKLRGLSKTHAPSRFTRNELRRTKIYENKIHGKNATTALLGSADMKCCKF